MSDIFQSSCSGNLSAYLVKNSNLELELIWFLQLHLNPLKTQKESYDYSVLIERVPISPRAWIDLEGVEYIGKDEGSFYDGYNGIHHSTSYLFLKFLKRKGNSFEINLDMKLEEEVSLSPLSKESISELSLKAHITFEGLKVGEDSIESSYANFTNPDWLKSLVSKYINLEHLEGPFYPFPPPEPYSKNSYASFEPLIE